MIKIGIECEQLESPSWGIGRIILKLLQEIARRPELRNEFEFYLFFKSRIPELPFLDDPIFRKKIVWQPLPYKSFVLYYYVFLPLSLWFSGLRAMFYPNYMLPIIHPPQVRSLVLLTDDIWHEMRSSQQRPHHRLAYWVFGYWSAWFGRTLMAISETSKRELVRLFGIDPRRITVNHLGVDVPHLEGSAPHTRPFLLYVGQAFPRRHLKETLQAFERIAPEFPKLDFIVIGPDKYKPPIIDDMAQQINHRLGFTRVLHISHVADEMLARYYAHGAKALTYISSREAFGLPPMEALGHGCIPVLADLPLSHELFGDNAFFVENPDSAESIAKTLRELLTDEQKCASIKQNAPDIIERFSWKAHTDRFLRIVKDLVHA